MNEWLTYERKRAAFERKWKVVIERALKKQTLYYVEQYKAGRLAGAMPDLTFTELLYALYGDVGHHFAGTTNRQIRASIQGGRRIGSLSRPEGVEKSIGQNKELHEHTQGMAKGYSGNGNRADTAGGGRAQEQRQVLVLKSGSLGFSPDWANRVIDRLRDAGLRFAQKISNETRNILLRILEQAQSDNLTLDETVTLMVERATEINASRAESIARTEVGRAATEGKMQGAKALGVELEKVWISSRDNRTRHNPRHDPKKGDHWVLNGQRKPFDEPFDNGVHQIMQPGDKNAPASETIRCRCTVIFKVKTDPQGRAIERNYLTA